MFNPITETLVHDYAYFLGYAKKLTCNYYDAEDIVQEAFLKAHKIDVTSVAHPKTWMVQIIRNTYRDLIRKKQALPCVDLSDQCATPSTHESDASHHEFRERLDTAISAPASKALKLNFAIFMAFACDEQSYQELAQQNAVSIASVSGRIYRARVTLREKLDAFR